MATPSRQIGWGTKANLLWTISKQVEALTGVMYNRGTTTTTTTTSLPYSVALLAFAIPDDGSGVACTNASNPLLLSPIYWAPGVGVEANVTLLYTDEALTVSAASGYYSDGSVYYAVNIFGLVQVIGSCA